jgi:hypothetical protein
MRRPSFRNKNSLNTRQHEVFFSFALSDRKFAGEVADELRRSGLFVVQMSDLGAAGEYNDQVRRALRRSAAVVVPLPNLSARHDVPASVLFEIGAAVGAEKPIYVIVDQPSGKLPFGAPGLQILPLNRLDEIARKINDGLDQ